MGLFYEELKGMGRGWFILRLAQDMGISINISTTYGTKNSMSKRNDVYNKTKSDHMKMLDEIISNWDNRITGGQPKLSNRELYDIAIQIKKLSVSSKTNSVDKFPFYGPDQNTKHVRYADNVLENERVSGLCEYLEHLYDDVIDHVWRIFGCRNEFGKIDVILSKEKPTSVIENDVASWLKKQFNVFGERLTVEQIQKIVDSRFISLNVLGRFVRGNHNTDERPYIVIYYTNTGIKRKNQLERYFAQISSTFAHEYFHYFHYSYASHLFKMNMAWGELAVTESLADVFAYDFLMRHHKFINKKMRDVAMDRYKFWVKYFGSSIAYAEALHFIIMPYKEADYPKMRNVFTLSRTSSLDAFMLLIS